MPTRVYFDRYTWELRSESNAFDPRDDYYTISNSEIIRNKTYYLTRQCFPKSEMKISTSEPQTVTGRGQRFYVSHFISL